MNYECAKCEKHLSSDTEYCDDCAADIAERAYECFMERYYGACDPVTLQEQQEAARRLK